MHADQEGYVRSLRQFVGNCLTACTPANEEKCLRDAAAVWGALPSNWGQATFDQDEVMSMIEVGAYESAAIALVYPGSTFMLSHGITGLCLATVVPPHDDEEFTAEAASLAIALICADGAARLTSK